MLLEHACRYHNNYLLAQHTPKCRISYHIYNSNQSALISFIVHCFPKGKTRLQSKSCFDFWIYLLPAAGLVISVYLFELMKSPGHHTQTLSCKYSANVFKSLKTPLTFISLVRLHVKSTRKQSVSLLLLITTVDNVILYSYKYLKLHICRTALYKLKKTYNKVINIFSLMKRSLKKKQLYKAIYL